MHPHRYNNPRTYRRVAGAEPETQLLQIFWWVGLGVELVLVLVFVQPTTNRLV